MLKYRTILEALETSTERWADRPALIGANVRWSYAQLQQRSQQIARQLLTHGVGAGSRVGLFANRSPDAIAAMVAILRSGAAYVPLDPSYPANLLRTLCEDSGPALLLASEELLAIARDGFWSGTVLPIESAPPRPTATGQKEPGTPGPASMPQIGPDDAAYIMYTSGSTGRPKGVVVPHRAVVRLVCDNTYANLGPDETLLQLAPLSFDASTFEIWGALLNGGRLAFPDTTLPSLNDIATAIAQYQVTTLWLTAGLFHLMVDNRPQALLPLRQLLAGGDVLSPPHVAKAVRLLAGGRLINGYGPTENTTFSCCYTVPLDYAGDCALPIGTAIANTQAYILDSALQPVPCGDVGELYVGGQGVALGYLNLPELTAERFIADPFDATPGAKLYKTGDRARLRSDGNIEFLGRADRQVKINGKRVEIDEVEMRLRAVALVRDAAVICEELPGQRRLVAYITASTKGPLPIDELRRQLRSELPDYMVPAVIVHVEALPLTANGKVDRNALPPARVQSPFTPPAGGASSVETLLLGLWREALGAQEVGLQDNFFDIGGTSLQLLQLHERLVARIGQPVSVVELFQYPTIAKLAAFLSSRDRPVAGLLSADERARRQRAALSRPARSAVPGKS